MQKRSKIVRVKLLRPKPKNGLYEQQRVTLIYDDDDKVGTLVRLGPDQCEVRWDSNPKISHYYSNIVVRPL